MAKTTRRDNHSGRLELRGTKWLAVWMVGGKRHSRSTGETDRVKAEAWLAKQLEAVKTADGLRAIDKDAETIRDMQATVLGAALQQVAERKAALESEADKTALTLDEAWSAYVASPKRKDCTAGTLNNANAKYRRLRDWLAQHHPEIAELRQITPDIAAQFAASIRGVLVPSTYNQTLGVLGLMWRVLRREIKGGINPWTGAEIPRRILAQTNRRDLSDAELRTVIDRARTDAPDLADLFVVLVSTGLRLGDGATLQWSDIDLERGFLSLVPAKTARYHRRVTIPIMPPLRAMLERTPAHQRQGYVLPALAREYTTAHQNLSHRIVRFFARCGLTTSIQTTVGNRRHAVLGAHSFRHSFVTRAANAGIPLDVVRRIVGHSGVRMSEHYFHDDDAATLAAFKPLASKPLLGDSDDAIEAEATVVPLARKSRLDALSDALRAIVDSGDAAEITAARQAIADILA